MFNKEIFLKNKTALLVILVVLTIKAILFLWAAYNFDFISYPQGNWLNIWDRWDSKVYKTIAQSSYNFIDIKLDFWAFLSHFPPLYSLTMAVVSRLLNISMTNAGVLVSLTAIIVASNMLYKLVYLEVKKEGVAWLSVIFLNLYPTSYFSISIYSESLFLLMAIWSFYCLKKEYYFLSGLAAAGAVLTRFVGVVFIPIYILYFLCSYKKSGFNLKIIYLPLLSLIGLIAYLTINRFYFGDYFYFLNEKLSFNTTKHLIFPLKETCLNFLAIFKSYNFSDGVFMMTRGWNAIFTLLSLVITVFGFRKINWIYAAYSLISILIFSSLSWGISNARYTLSVFPIFITLALIENRFLTLTILTASTFMSLYFTRIYTSGAWAF